MRSYYWQNENKKRYYKMTVYKDMLEDYSVQCAWGSLVSRRGNAKTVQFADYDALTRYIDYMLKRRKRRGYTITTSPTLYRTLRAPIKPYAANVFMLNEASVTR